MIGAFNQKMTSQNNTTIVNSTGGSKEPTSAAMVANFNIDPIRRVRSQFAV
jgi:capsular polysaccharide biosynthesis protein